MSNDRLRARLIEAGLEIEDLATQVEVDAKTVQRWLGGRTPHARHRAKVAKVLHIEEHELWTETTPDIRSRDDRHEISDVFAHTNDVRVPGWRKLMQEARQRIELLDYSLIEILGAPGAIDLLAKKAADGCQIQILIAHPKSIWVTSAAEQLGMDDPDYEGNTELDREIALARGHLEPLIGESGIELRTFWAERYNTILRLDDVMLVTLHLWATPGPQAPLLHLHRRGAHGIFDQFAGHLDAIRAEASEPIEANPDLYPPPSANPERYQPITEELGEKRRREAQERSEHEIATALPLEHAREQIRRRRAPGE